MSKCLAATAAAAKSLQSCPTLCDPIDGSPPGSPIPGILQARTLEWFVISFSNAWRWKMKVKSLGHVWLLPTPWIAAYQAPPSMGFSRQESWSGVPLPSPKVPCRGGQKHHFAHVPVLLCLTLIHMAQIFTCVSCQLCNEDYTFFSKRKTKPSHFENSFPISY